MPCTALDVPITSTASDTKLILWNDVRFRAARPAQACGIGTHLSVRAIRMVS